MDIHYRCWYRGQPPRPIRLRVPGWSGDPGYRDGCDPQPWHCKPFVDGSTYGLELVYPFANECVISGTDGGISIRGDFTEDERQCGVPMPPFMAFAPDHYGFTSSIDLQTPPGIVTRIEPHPRFYTDRTGTAPVPLPGHIETEWWSRVFFLVFKSPRSGEDHVFRPGEPYAQLLFIPGEVEYRVGPMTAAEVARRTVRDECLGKHGGKLCTRSFTDPHQHVFNNTYKCLSRTNAREGAAGVDRVIAEKLSSLSRPLRIRGCPLKTGRTAR